VIWLGQLLTNLAVALLVLMPNDAGVPSKRFFFLDFFHLSDSHVL
jgi:hypothetical protein